MQQQETERKERKKRLCHEAHDKKATMHTNLDNYTSVKRNLSLLQSGIH